MNVQMILWIFLLILIAIIFGLVLIALNVQTLV